jgi:protein gp37
MYYLDKFNNNNGQDFYLTKNFEYPLKKDKQGNYKIKSGETLRVCMTSDFFYDKADPYRDRCWEIIKERSDVKFYLLTKRAERIEQCLPKDWNEGYENVMLNVTCENQAKADERIPILFNLKAKHKGIFVAPFIGEVHIEKYLKEHILEQVICGGENYDGARPCDYDWVKSLSEQCKNEDTTFCFIEVGNIFIKDGVAYKLNDKELQSQKALRLGFNYVGKQYDYILKDKDGNAISKENLYKPMFNEDRCKYCSSKIFCNGCSNCGKCKNVKLVPLEKIIEWK